MAKGGGVVVSQAKLKKKLDQLSSQIYQINLQIQTFKQQGNTQHIPYLEAELQKSVVETQIKFELKKAQGKSRH